MDTGLLLASLLRVLLCLVFVDCFGAGSPARGDLVLLLRSVDLHFGRLCRSWFRLRCLTSQCGARLWAVCARTASLGGIASWFDLQFSRRSHLCGVVGLMIVEDMWCCCVALRAFGRSSGWAQL